MIYYFAILFLLILIYLYFRNNKNIYILDFTVYEPSSSNNIVTIDRFKQLQRLPSLTFSNESLEFMDKLIDRNGLGETTLFPDSILHHNPPQLNLQHARQEAEQVIFSILDDLFLRTGVGPMDIDVLIVNCSLFSPTPSLTSMIVNKYKMKESILTYNLSGMGCSASLISIHLARELLTNHNKIALVVSTENITQNWYKGNDKSMLISNTLFRMGGAAILLSNHKQKAKYKLSNIVRTHCGSNDNSYQSVFQDTDKDGHVGVRLDKNISSIAGLAITKNIKTLAKLVLPYYEQLQYLLNKKKIFDINTLAQHFCIHAGGKGILDGLQLSLKLTNEQIRASRETLLHYGNVSSASIWYELKWLERQHGRIHKKDKIFQLSFGSGFKCNSAIWQCI